MPVRTLPGRAGGLFRLFAAVSLILMLASCGGGSGAVETKADTTVLVYVIATDLEERGSEATKNLAEMQRVAPNDKVNLVLATGGARKEGWNTLQRKRVLGSRIELIEDLGEKDMGQVSTLQEFIEWGVKTYPAQRYMLVFWNHGGGPNGGVGPDTLSDSVLSLPMLNEAVANARASTGAHFDLIGFDACLMASVEIAQAFAPHANYLLASQELEPGGGWSWEAFMRQLTANPAVDVESFGRAVIDAYIAKQLAEDPGSLSTLSLTDLRRAGPVIEALEAVAGTLNRQLSADPVAAWHRIADARARAVSFYTPRLAGGTDLTDPLSFLSWSDVQLADGQYEKLEAALREAVRYERHTDSYPPLSGLSMYMPQNTLSGVSTLERYARLDFSEPVQSFVREYARIGKDFGAIPLPAVGAVEPGSGGGLRVEVGNSESVMHGFVALQADQGRIVAARPPTAFDGREMSDADPSGGWFAIGDDPARRIPVLMIPDGERYAEDDPYRYVIPVKVETDDEPGERYDGMLFVRSDDRGALRIVSFLMTGLNESPTVARPEALPPRARYAPRFMTIRENSLPEWGYDPANFVTLDDPVVFQGATLTQGTVRFGVEDHRGYIVLDRR